MHGISRSWTGRVHQPRRRMVTQRRTRPALIGRRCSHSWPSKFLYSSPKRSRPKNRRYQSDSSTFRGIGESVLRRTSAFRSDTTVSNGEDGRKRPWRILAETGRSVSRRENAIPDIQFGSLGLKVGRAAVSAVYFGRSVKPASIPNGLNSGALPIESAARPAGRISRSIGAYPSWDVAS
jgi:hypothetical protein